MSTPAIRNDPSARLKPEILLANALIVMALPIANPCDDSVVTVILLAPNPPVPAEASVTTLTTEISLPGIS